MFKSIQLKKDQSIWITSDTHFGHINLIKNLSKWKDKSGCRNFDSIEDHDNTIIDNINNLVKKTDILYHLGDWSFGDIDNIKKYRNRINCKDIRLVLGNHDKYIEPKDSPYRGCFTSVDWIDGFSIKKEDMPFKVKFYLSHCAHRVWFNNHHGSISLFAHSHGSLLPKEWGRSMDVGLDTNNFYPYHLDEIIYFMKDIELLVLDHHNIETT